MDKNKKVEPGPGLMEFLSEEGMEMVEKYYEEHRLRNPDGSVNQSGVDHMNKWIDEDLPEMLKMLKATSIADKLGLPTKDDVEKYKNIVNGKS